MEQVMRVATILKEPSDGQTISPTPANFAAKAKLMKWETEYTTMIWQATWSKKGLQIVQPRVYTKDDIVLAPGHGLLLQGVAS